MKIIALLTSLLLVGCSADSTVNINQSPKASVMTGFTMAVGDAITSPVEFYQSRDCQDATNNYNNNSNAVMAYETMNVAVANSKGIDCAVNLQDDEVATYTYATFSLCRLADSDMPLDKATSFGMSGMHPYEKWIAEFNEKNGAALTPRIYKGSGATIKGLIAKEIDWGFIATPVARKEAFKDKVTCLYTTGPMDAAFLGRTYEHDLADLRIKVLVLAKGDFQAQIKEDLKGEKFSKYLSKFGYDFVTHNFAVHSDNFRNEFEVLKSFY